MAALLFWALIFALIFSVVTMVYIVWRRGYTIQELVRNPPQEADLPEIVTILSYLHHELIKHRLPLVSTVSDQPFDAVDQGDVAMLKEAVTGTGGRPSLIGEMDGYVAGLRRAAGSVHLNFWRDALIRKARAACSEIQAVADNMGPRVALTRREHQRLRASGATLDDWFRPRLQAIRNSVLSLELSADLFEEPIERILREMGIADAEIEPPQIDEHYQVRMLGPDFNLVLRNLARNGLQRSLQATGEARLAIEVDHRIELTGEESVLIRIHDTDPTMLSRQDLYGGSIGRGLNLVTTTLKRYEGALSCQRSRLEGYAKYMEIRLFQAHAQPEDAILLRKPDPLTRAVPAALLTSLALAASVCGAGIFGILPDPMVEYGLLPDSGQEAQFFANRDGQERGEDIAAQAAKRATAVQESILTAMLNNPEIRKRRIPGPDAIEIDARRCKVERFTDERRMSAQCALLNNRSRLQAPLLLFEVMLPFDMSQVSVEVRDLVQQGNTTRTLEPGKSCMEILTLPPKGRIPKDKAAGLPNSISSSSRYSRLLLDYRRCLAMPRYPIRSKVTLKLAAGLDEDLPQIPELQPTTIDVQVKLRRLEQASDAYARISNDERTLPSRAARMALAQALARHVAQDHFYNRDAGLDINDKELALAIYFGWIRPGLYNGIWARVENARKRKKQPGKDICDLYPLIEESFGHLQELDPKEISAELYRSQYYLYQGKLWIEGDIAGAMQDFEAFQRLQRTKTDFVQGARLYMAMLLTLGPAPPTDGSAPEPAVQTRVDQITELLLALRKDARKPPRRGAESPYEKVKLLGMRALAGSGDEGHTVNDILCAFGRANPQWIMLMDDDAYNTLMTHCDAFPKREPPTPQPPKDPAGPTDPIVPKKLPDPKDPADPKDPKDPKELDNPKEADPKAPTGQEGPLAPTPQNTIRLDIPPTERIHQATRYIKSFSDIFKSSASWKCE